MEHPSLPGTEGSTSLLSRRCVLINTARVAAEGSSRRISTGAREEISDFSLWNAQTGWNCCLHSTLRAAGGRGRGAGAGTAARPPGISESQSHCCHGSAPGQGLCEEWGWHSVPAVPHGVPRAAPQRVQLLLQKHKWGSSGSS